MEMRRVRIIAEMLGLSVQVSQSWNVVSCAMSASSKKADGHLERRVNSAILLLELAH